MNEQMQPEYLVEWISSINIIALYDIYIYNKDY